MIDFTDAASRWWSDKHGNRQQAHDAHQNLLDQMATVPADDPLRQAITTFIQFESDEVMHGSGPAAWRQREHLEQQVLDALADAILREDA